MGTSLRDAFFQGAGLTPGSAECLEPAELERALEDLVAQATREHPDLELPPVALAVEVGRAVQTENLAKTLAELQIADLALAVACAEANPRALAKFEREYGREVDQALARVHDVGMDREDFRQRIREKLFTAVADNRPRIASYGGRGSLRGWVRVTALRLALDLTRRRADPQHRVSKDADLIDRLPGVADPELAFMRSRWGSELGALLTTALEHLSPRQRNLLRYHYLHELSARRIAGMYGVHRATAFKWLEQARKALLEEISVLAQERLGVEAEELRSLMALLGSRLDLSVRRLVGSAIEPEVA